MPQYEVTFSRTELIAFVIEAQSPQEAEDGYLAGGDEVASQTTNITIVAVELATPSGT
jgi:hypothetical protein